MTFKINEEIYGNLATVYHGTQNIKSLLQAKFTPGFGAGSMYGKGIYGVYDPAPNSNTFTGKYGYDILKMAVSLKNMINIDKIYPSGLLDLDILNTELSAFKNIPQKEKSEITLLMRLYPAVEFTSDVAKPLADSKYRQYFDGIVYTGRQDGKCMVIYDMDNYFPLSTYNVIAKEWIKVDKNDFVGAQAKDFSKYKTKPAQGITAKKTYRDVLTTAKIISLKTKKPIENVIKHLINSYISKDVLDYGDSDFVSFAIQQNDIPLCDKLLEANGDEVRKQFPFQAAFVIGCSVMSLEMLDLFLHMHAFELTYTNPHDGNSTLWMAMQGENIPIIKYILDHKVPIGDYDEVCSKALELGYKEVYNLLTDNFLEKKDKVFEDITRLTDLFSEVEGRDLYYYCEDLEKKYPFSADTLYAGILDWFASNSRDSGLTYGYDEGYDNPENYLSDAPEGEDGEYTEEQKEEAGNISASEAEEESANNIARNFRSPPYTSRDFSRHDCIEVFDACLEYLRSDITTNREEVIACINAVLFLPQDEYIHCGKMIQRINRMYNKMDTTTLPEGKKTYKVRLL